MDLLEVFFEEDIWESIIDKSVDKTISDSMLRRYCKPSERVKLLDRILDGSYKINPPTVVQIPKDSGGMREIYVNRQEDRIILAGTNQALYRLYEDKLSSACKAYREGLSCAKVVREVSKQHVLGYKLDLSKYFDSVPREVINSSLAELDTGSPLDSILYDYYNDDTVIIDGKQVHRFKSLAQGCAVAAFLSNYVLRHVDEQMLSLCKYYCRYSDDMLILCDTQEEADFALHSLEEMLTKLGLALNPDKVESISSDKEFKFLGFGVTGQNITISQKDFQEKKAEVKHVCRLIEHDRKLSPEKKLLKAVNAVKRIFFGNIKHANHGWLYGKACAINEYSRLAELDNFCKEHIRAAVTGKWNYTHNVHKVPEDKLRSAGYLSLVHMAKLCHIDFDVYTTELMLSYQHTT